MNTPNKLRIDVYIDALNYSKLLDKCSKIGAKTTSIGLNAILNEYFLQKDEQIVAVERLNKIIQGYELKIRGLQHDIVHDADKKVAEIKKAQILRPI